MGYSPQGGKELDTTEVTEHMLIIYFIDSWHFNLMGVSYYLHLLILLKFEFKAKINSFLFRWRLILFKVYNDMGWQLK